MSAATEHPKRAARFVADEAYAAFHDNALWFVRQKRDKLTHRLSEWEALRQSAAEIKAHTLSHLADYLELFEKKATANGIQIHWAQDAREHNDIVLKILRKHRAKKVVKSKSMLQEECHMNPFLEAHQIEVIDTDLGERIIQLQQSRPSHIVMPAIHLKRETVGQLFEEHLHTEKGNSDPLYLTRAARAHLREKFLQAEVAMTGVNFAVAEAGCFAVCTNEGNADMGASLAKVHIASMGLEKIVPDFASLSVFTRLLARSATGQPITTYTSHFQKPVPDGELHVIIVDNGRSQTLHHPEHRTILKCIRCAACMNTCPVYRRSGGYSYNYFIPGPVGINLAAQNDIKTYKGDLAACSLCGSCRNVCPVKIDLDNQIYLARQRLGRKTARSKKKTISLIIKFIMERRRLYRFLSKIAPLINRLPRFLLYHRFNDWGKYHELPQIPKESFHTLWKKGKVTRKTT